MKNQKQIEVLAVIVNYGEEQLRFLGQMVKSLKSFKKYNVAVIIHSNIPITLSGVDEVKIFDLENYRFLPSTCRKTIWDYRDEFDLFFYSENDLMIKESHFDNFSMYSNILPKNRIAGLIRFEEESNQKYYPDYHADFDWKYNSVEKYEGKVFAHFTNLHQASFILTKKQLLKVGNRLDFGSLVKDKVPIYYKVKRRIRYWLGLKTKKHYIYDVLCKTCTDVYQYAGLKKVICISEFEDNLIHHMSDVYASGNKGNNLLEANEEKMSIALKKMKQSS